MLTLSRSSAVSNSVFLPGSWPDYAEVSAPREPVVLAPVTVPAHGDGRNLPTPTNDELVALLGTRSLTIEDVKCELVTHGFLVPGDILLKKRMFNLEREKRIVKTIKLKPRTVITYRVVSK